jgi:MATE family multidrug resistance protein
LYLDTHLPSNHRITQLTTYFFEVACVFLLFDGIRHMLAGALRGLHDSTTPMQIGIVCLWFISLPVSYAVGFHFHEGPIGLRLSFISGFVVASLLLFKRLQKQLTRMNDKAAPVEALAPTT